MESTNGTAANGAPASGTDDLITAELRKFDTVIVTDAGAALNVALREDDRVRLVTVTKPTDSLASADTLVLPAAKAGMPIYVWCTPNGDGPRVARDAGKKLSGHLPNGESGLYVLEPDPRRWLRSTYSLESVLEGASKKPPSLPRGRQQPLVVSPDLTSSPNDAGDFDVSPLRLAERILERPDWAPRCLLVFHGSQKFEALYTQDSMTGIWLDPEATVLGWLGAIGDSLEREAYEIAADKLIDPKTVVTMVRAIRGIKTPDRIKSVCHSFAAAHARLKDQGLQPSVRECGPDNLDADLRFLGVENGVIDLHEARLLKPEEAAPAFVTTFTPVPYDPELYPAADWFLSHLPIRERNWWLDVFGFALRGIAKRLYGCLAAPDSGKTTAINMMRSTFGPYVDTPTPGALDAHQRYEASGHTPGLGAWASPVRITILDEVKERELHAAIVKELTGGGVITYRDTYEKRRKARATGTTFLFANDAAGERQLPQLRTDDPGMRARYRELPFPTIPETQREPERRDEWPHDVKRRAQLLTLLVQRAANTPREPEDIPEAQHATATRIRKDSGELGVFASRLARDGTSVLEFPKLWAEWCTMNNEPADADAPGGVRKSDFYRRLSAHVEGLDRPTPLTIERRKVRGWRGWRLLTEAEAKAFETPTAQVAKQAINDLVEALTYLPEYERQDLRHELLQKLMIPEALVAIEETYGKDIDRALKGAFPISYGRNGEKLPGMRDSLIDQGFTVRQAELVERVLAVESLADAAEMIRDARRQKSHAFQEVLSRYHALPVAVSSRESRALNYLKLADKALCVDATAGDLAAEAARLVKADAVKLIDGEEAKMVYTDQSIGPDEARNFEAEVEAGIKELCGIG